MNIDEELYNRLKDNSNMYLNKIDKYGENNLSKCRTKVKAGNEIAHALSLNAYIVAGIIYGEGLMRTAFGEVGENFLREKNPNFSNVDFAYRNMLGIISEMESETSGGRILEGIRNLEERKDSKPEEQLAYLIIDGFNYADSLEKKEKRNICFINYKNKVMSQSLLNGAVTGIVIPTPQDLRQKSSSIDENRAMNILNMARIVMRNNYSMVPQSFKKAYAGLDIDTQITYYVGALSESELERISNISLEDKTHSNNIDDIVI